MANDPQENQQVLQMLQEMEDDSRATLRFVARARKALGHFSGGAIVDELQERRERRRRLGGIGGVIGIAGFTAWARKHSDKGKALLVSAAAVGGVAVGAGATMAIAATLDGAGSERDEAAPRPIVLAPSPTTKPPTKTPRPTLIAAPPARSPTPEHVPTDAPRPTTVVTRTRTLPPKVITRPPSHRPSTPPTRTPSQPETPPTTTEDDDSALCNLLGIGC